MNIIVIIVVKILSTWSLEKKIRFALHAKAGRLADLYPNAALSAREAEVKLSKPLLQIHHATDARQQVVRVVVFNEKKY